MTLRPEIWGVNTHFVFLVPLQQSLGPSHILGQLICRDDGLSVVQPADQVPVVGQETV